MKPKELISKLETLNERQAFKLLDHHKEEIGRGIFFKGIYRMCFGKFLKNKQKDHIDYQKDQLYKLINDFEAKDINNIKHLFSPDLNKPFVHLLYLATGIPLYPVRDLLQNYEDYYALTQTTAKDIMKLKIKGIGQVSANKISATMAIIRGNF